MYRNKKGMRAIPMLIIGFAVAAVIGFMLIYSGSKGIKTTSTTLTAFQGKFQFSSTCIFDTTAPVQETLTGDSLLENVAACGYCIEVKGGKYELHLRDTDQDGIPDKCDTDPFVEPEAGTKFEEHCKGKTRKVKNNLAKYTRCCIPENVENKYCP